MEPPGAAPERLKIDQLASFSEMTTVVLTPFTVTTI
jgi:hypothetical protein